MYNCTLWALVFNVFLRTPGCCAQAPQPNAEASGAECNGYQEFCTRKYSEVSFACTHNSFAALDNNIASNQNTDIRQQLDSGIRAFMLDLHTAPPKSDNLRALQGSLNSAASGLRLSQDVSGVASEIELCHTNCILLDDGLFIDQLANYKKYLSQNTREVITLFIENYDTFASADIYSVFQAAKLDEYMLSRPLDGNSTWPTLGDMIQTNKRLVVFTDRNYDPNFPMVIDGNSFYEQTSFEVQVGTNFDCALKSQEKDLTVMNHFFFKNQNILGVTYQVPVMDNVSTINSKDSILAQADTCKLIKKFPNFVAVDFASAGDLNAAVASINGVSEKSLTTTTFEASNVGNSDRASSGVLNNAPGKGALNWSIFGSLLKYLL